MSAICGIIHFDERPVDRSDLETMVASSPDRGPDGSRYCIFENAGFAHLAFHATPESVNEKQPLVSDDGRLVLVADVRLDNRQELARKLDIARDRQDELTDPELLLHAYREWGNDCVLHLLGDFVFAVWSRETRTLFLARDPLGGYSVTWHQVGQSFIFASETTAILDLDFVDPKIKQENVAKVLAHLPRGAEETFFESVFFLPAAHTLVASANQRTVRRYWDIDPQHRLEYPSEADYAEHFLELVREAVHCRMRSIKPVGIALSGGHDSALLAACAAGKMPGNDVRQDPLRSFSYIFDQHEESDERRYISAVVEQYGLDATYLLADDLWTFRNLPEQAVQRDYLWTNCYVQLPESTARSAGQSGCGILIDGQFGDALCSGQSMFAAELLRHGRIKELFSIFRQHGDELNWRGDLIDRGIRPLLPAWLRHTYRKFVSRELTPFVSGLDERWAQRLRDCVSDEPVSDVINELGPARKLRYGYLLNSSWSHGFAAVRGPTFGRHGVERVSPYFDRRIVEFVMAVPGEQLAHPGKYRRLQTNAMKRVLPPLIYERRIKASFDPLLQQGLLVREQRTVQQLLEDTKMVSQGWISKHWLDGQLAAGADWEIGGYPFSMCLHLELWLKAIDEVSTHGAKWAVPYRYRPRVMRGRQKS